MAEHGKKQWHRQQQQDERQYSNAKLLVMKLSAVTLLVVCVYHACQSIIDRYEI
jgi:hypothetical protein